MSGSAKAGTTAERHKCELRMLANADVRAPPKRASGGLRFPLTKTYMDVGTTEQVIKNHLRSIFDKLGVWSRLELAMYVASHGGKQWPEGESLPATLGQAIGAD